MKGEQQAQEAGTQIQQNPAYRVLVGIGVASFGLIHLLWGWLCVRLALGDSNEDASTQGAMASMGSQPLGQVLLIVMVVGLFAMTLWQAIEAAVGYSFHSGAKRTQKRLASVGRAAVYALLGITAIRLLTHSQQSDSNTGAKNASEGLMSQPFGQVLVAIVGLVIVILGIGQILKGVNRTFVDDDLDGQVADWAKTLGVIGWSAKGLALAAVGLLFGWAALSKDARKAGGLDQALKTLRDQPFGPIVLFVVAVGFAAFGVYCFVWAKNVRHDKD